LQSRAIANQVEIYLLDEQQTAEIEPCAKTFYKSLFIPSTSTANPLLLINSIKNDFLNDGGILLNNCRYIKRLSDTKIKTTKNTIAYKKFINCAGLYADKIAHDFNLGKDYTIIPFKGLYLYGDDNAPKINSHIYPVPNLDNPFLGVHVTRSIEGTTKIGPTAIPAFWRENYSGIDNFSLRDLFEILPLEALLFLRNKNGFRDLAIQEVQKYSRYNLVKDASKLCKNLDAKSFKKWGRSGIRAQLFNIKNKSLEMDFVIDKDDYGIHVLNAISPAWTCSMPFAKYIVNMMNG
jgi:L-2-hydroxyglutarate oxidase LhgO